MEKKFDINKIREIYALLQDDTSKYIFENQLMYSLTGEKRFIRNVACTNEVVEEIYNRLKSTTQKKILFGAGGLGKKLVRVYDDVRFECFVDNYHAGQVCSGLPVIDIQELKEKYLSEIIIISSIKYYEEIFRQLLEEGFKEENIINIGAEYRKMNHLQYFDLPALENSRSAVETFVDGGCYDGETTLEFINWLKSSWGGIYVWEPNSDYAEKCEQLFKDKGIKHKLISRGMWSETGTLKFKLGGKGSRISEQGDAIVEVDCIDHAINERVSFIKLDIEGAEYQALLGARQTISAYAPKLAVCVYHKPEDIWEIPCLVNEINSDYVFYLRHYSFGENETVLYAMPRNENMRGRL